jgi:hypothetical protein
MLLSWRHVRACFFDCHLRGSEHCRMGLSGSLEGSTKTPWENRHSQAYMSIIRSGGWRQPQETGR